VYAARLDTVARTIIEDDALIATEHIWRAAPMTAQRKCRELLPSSS